MGCTGHIWPRTIVCRSLNPQLLPHCPVSGLLPRWPSNHSERASFPSYKPGAATGPLSQQGEFRLLWGVYSALPNPLLLTMSPCTGLRHHQLNSCSDFFALLLQNLLPPNPIPLHSPRDPLPEQVTSGSSNGLLLP